MYDPCFTKKHDLFNHIRKNKKRTVIVNHTDVGLDEFNILQTNEWFNDKIINFYFYLVQMYANTFNISVYVFSTFFYSSLKAKGVQWVLKYTRKENIFKNDFIFIPIHRSCHWSFVCVDLNNKAIEHYDSLYSNDSLLRDILKYLECERENKNLKALEYKVVKRSCPKQNNGYDCGLFVCLYARNRIFGTHMSFAKRDMFDYRLRIAHELLEKEIIYSLGHTFTK